MHITIRGWKGGSEENKTFSVLKSGREEWGETTRKKILRPQIETGGSAVLHSTGEKKGK